MLIVFYISGHGFGHASRDIELINALVAARADVRIVARTTVPAWLFARARTAVDIQPIETDTGLVQIDSLRFDERESARRAAAFYRTFDERVDAEARVLRTLGADLVVGDIPPLAFAAAERAGVRSMAIGNFTWDWIYGVYPAFEELAPDVIPTIRAAYATATRALRLPFHGGFEPMAAVTDDIPLIARRSRRDPADTRRLLGIADDRPLVLASFGAYGAPLPYDAVRAAWRAHGVDGRTTSAARPGVSGSGGSSRRRGQQAGLRHRVGMHRERHGAAVHIARPVHRVRRVRRRDAARASVSRDFAGGSVRGPLGRRRGRAPCATRTGGAAARGRRRDRGGRSAQGRVLIGMLYCARCSPAERPRHRRPPRQTVA